MAAKNPGNKGFKLKKPKPFEERERDTRFKKGVSGNPGGRNCQPKHVIEFKKTTYNEFINKINLYGSMRMDLLEQEIAKDEILAFDCMFATVVYKAAKGDKNMVDVITERLWGKPKEEMAPAFAAEQEFLKQIPISELIAIARKYKDGVKTEVIEAHIVENK